MASQARAPSGVRSCSGARNSTSHCHRHPSERKRERGHAGLLLGLVAGRHPADGSAPDLGPVAATRVSIYELVKVSVDRLNVTTAPAESCNVTMSVVTETMVSAPIEGV